MWQLQGSARCCREKLMDMGLSCWSQSCSLSLKPWPVQQPGRMLSAVCYRWEADQTLALTGSLSCTAVSAHLSDTPADHILAPYFYLKWACRQKAQVEQGARPPSQPCRQSRAQRTSPAPFPSGRHSAPPPRPALALNRKVQPGDKIRHRELDCTLLSSLNELRCTTRGWLLLTFASFQLKSGLQALC